MTKEARQKMGIIEDGAVAYGLTLLKQQELLVSARLKKYLADNLAVSADDLVTYNIDPKQMHLVPSTPAYKFEGKDIDVRIGISKVNKALKPALKKLREAYRGNQQVLNKISALEKELAAVQGKSDDALIDLLSDVKQLMTEAGVRIDPPKEISKFNKGQQALATAIRKWLNRGSRATRLEREARSSDELLEEFLSTREGLALERAFKNPALMWNFRSKKEFFETVRYPGKGRARNFAEEITDDPEAIVRFKERRQKQLESYQRRFGALKELIPKLKEVDLTEANKALVEAEDIVSNLRFQKEGLLEALEDNKMGQLAGKFIPAEVWKMVKGTFEPKSEFGEKAMLVFKHAKVIWNPASYPRNAMSAMIQNWWKLGLGPWRIDTYYDAVKEMKTGGKYLKEMKELGFHERTGAVNELLQNYLRSELIGETIATQTGKSLAKVKQQLKHFDRWAVNFYSHIDNVAKVAAYKHGRTKGLSPEDALKSAYAATFNYSHVTPFVNTLRRAIWGVPFITFNLKAIPLVASTLANNPTRISVFGKARNALFQSAGVGGQEESEVMPEYMRDGFYLRLPWKDADGRAMYFDLSYIIPFGGILTGEYAENPSGVNPVLQTIKELSQNRTFGGQKIWRESDSRDQIIADIFLHVSKLGLPPIAADQLQRGYADNGEKIYGSFRGQLDGDDRGPGERTFYQEMFRIAGMNVTPFDLESRERQFEYRRKKALQQLLVQRGVLNEFVNPYVPKEDVANIDPFAAPGQTTGPEVDPLGR
jgi:hypothetical protein